MPDLTDHGLEPYVTDIEEATVDNANFRSTLWTGAHLQLTVMSIAVGGDIGLEVHPDNDQFLRVEQGTGRVQMGRERTTSPSTKKSRRTGPSSCRLVSGTTSPISETSRSRSTPSTGRPTTSPARSMRRSRTP